MKIHGVATLGVSQALALLAALGGAAVYAAWLDPVELAVWALALSVGRAAMLLVDGGLKAALVRHPQGLDKGAERRLTACVMAAALGLSALAFAAGSGAAALGRASADHAALVTASVVCYLLSHAGSLAALARLERSGRFDRVGRVEGAATVLEFSLPAALMAVGIAVMPALVAGVVIGRLGRALGLLHEAAQESKLSAPVAPGAALVAPPWQDGFVMQGIAALGLLRDQIHLWLVGPLFGAAWAGAYAFGLMACALASQVVVATVSRVAVPALRTLAPRRRAWRAARSLRRLALLTLPLLALVAPGLHLADAHWWQGQWSQALTLLPGLLVRMVAALPLAVLAPWLLLATTPRAAAAVHIRWTLLELLLAVAALAWLGPTGLAVAWAIGGVLGTGLFAWALRGHGLGLFLRAVWRLPQRGPRARRLARA
jgi:O-antigen/teichoic acid export membrane protein